MAQQPGEPPGEASLPPIPPAQSRRHQRSEMLPRPHRTGCLWTPCAYAACSTHIRRVVVPVGCQRQPHEDTGYLEEGILERAQEQEPQFPPVTGKERCLWKARVPEPFRPHCKNARSSPCQARRRPRPAQAIRLRAATRSAGPAPSIRAAIDWLGARARLALARGRRTWSW